MKPNDPVTLPRLAHYASRWSFHSDATTRRQACSLSNPMRLGALSLGAYEAGFVPPKIFETLGKTRVTSICFVPSCTAARRRDKAGVVLTQDNESGHHGCLGDRLATDWRDPDVDALVTEPHAPRGMVSLRPLGGHTCKHKNSRRTMRPVNGSGVNYDSSSTDQVRFHGHLPRDGALRLLELPVHRNLDYVPHGLFPPVSSGTIVSHLQRLEIWKDGFHDIYRWCLPFSLTMRAQVSGVHLRSTRLPVCIAWTKTLLNVWFARRGPIAQAWTGKPSMD